MPRTSLVLTGVLIVTCALLASGCGSSESVQGETPPRTADGSEAESSEDGDAASSPESFSGAVSEAPQGAVAAGGESTGGSQNASYAVEESQNPAPAEPPRDIDAPADTTPPSEMEDGEMDDPSTADAYQPRTSPAGLSVTRAYICRGIEESEPTDAGRSFLPKEDGINRLCCFSEIMGAAGPDSIWHVWYWGEREMGSVGLEVKSSSWRTWSRKQVLDEWKGEWHVDIIDAAGFLLYRLEFSIE